MVGPCPIPNRSGLDWGRPGDIRWRRKCFRNQTYLELNFELFLMRERRQLLADPLLEPKLLLHTNLFTLELYVSSSEPCFMIYSGVKYLDNDCISGKVFSSNESSSMNCICYFNILMDESNISNPFQKVFLFLIHIAIFLIFFGFWCHCRLYCPCSQLVISWSLVSWWLIPRTITLTAGLNAWVLPFADLS